MTTEKNIIKKHPITTANRNTRENNGNKEEETES